MMKSGSSLTEGTDFWRKQSQMKDIELSVVCTKLKRKEGTCNSIVHWIKNFIIVEPKLRLS